MLSFYVSGSPGFVFLNPFFLATDDCRSVLAVKVRCAASRPGPLRADPADVAVYEGKGMDGLGCRVFRAVLAGPKGTFRSYQPPEP